MNEIQQPETIEFGGKRYIRIEEVQEIGNGITEGPFYCRNGVDARDWAYTPDARFIAGLSDTPSFMHVVQQRADYGTTRPE